MMTRMMQFLQHWYPLKKRTRVLPLGNSTYHLLFTTSSMTSNLFGGLPFTLSLAEWNILKPISMLTLFSKRPLPSMPLDMMPYCQMTRPFESDLYLFYRHRFLRLSHGFSSWGADCYIIINNMLFTTISLSRGHMVHSILPFRRFSVRVHWRPQAQTGIPWNWWFTIHISNYLYQTNPVSLSTACIQVGSDFNRRAMTSMKTLHRRNRKQADSACKRVLAPPLPVQVAIPKAFRIGNDLAIDHQ